VIRAPMSGRSPPLRKTAEHFRASIRVARRDAQVLGAARGSTAPQGPFPSPESLGVSTAALESIAACESGGDPTAVSADGTYGGKYQFDYETWSSVGGSGDPGRAGGGAGLPRSPPLQQDRPGRLARLRLAWT